MPMKAKKIRFADRDPIVWPKFRLIPSLVSLSGLALVILCSLICTVLSSRQLGDFSSFEPGMVSDRDIIAEHRFSYINQEESAKLRDTRIAETPAVFQLSEQVGKDCLSAFSVFSDLVQKESGAESTANSFIAAVQAKYPSLFSRSVLQTLYAHPSRNTLLQNAEELFKRLLERGVFSIPARSLERYNQEVIELERRIGGRMQTERIPLSQLISLKNAEAYLVLMAEEQGGSEILRTLAAPLLLPFFAENVFFSAEESEKRVAEVLSRLSPVYNTVEKGEKILRKGFLVRQEDMEKLAALGQSRMRIPPSMLIGRLVLLILVFGLMMYLSGKRVVGKQMAESEVYLVAAITVLYLLSAGISTLVWPSDSPLFLSLFLPTALFTMLPAILIGPRLASAVAVSLPLAALVSGYFDVSGFLFAFASGVLGAFSLQVAARRMDLIRAGALIAVAQILTALGLLFFTSVSADQFPPALFWAALNGLLSALVVLGILPLFEQLMNTATVFRLIELSDLNSPMLKRLLTIAPGTYSHSVMVANLAESACREIGANSLLARVGAYYHDIGKMDQPDYFIENQAVYNKHDDISPRLSATVIRSHVKLGVEKARAMGLPSRVVDIIAEHHGDSVISWFYNEALKQEDRVNREDFSYPGTPPASRESAVIMLADTVEAAMRTLKKPTVSKMEKHVQDLIMAKFNQGQLSNSLLTFRDLEHIKNAFIRVLAGHYHSRIEYPKQKEVSR